MAHNTGALVLAPVAMTGAVALTLGGTPAFAADADARSLHRAVGHTPHATGLPEVATAATAVPSSAIPRVAYTAASAPTTHTVRPGDTITGIAIQHGLRTIDVLNWNDLGWSSVIYPGDVISLQAPSSGGGTGESPEGSPSTPPAPDPDPAPDSGAKTYTVKAGDTLWGIAIAHGLSIGKLLQLNGLSMASIIYPGQSIVVHAAEAERPPSIYDSPEYDLHATLNAPQAENARLIISIGRGLGVSDQGIAIALATSMVESSLRNLDWGDRDSVGLFQQRPSAGWGTAEELVDRGIATTRFFHGHPSGSTRGLLDIPGWETLPFGDAAQAVQVSAFPERYDRWRVAAWGWLAQHG